MWSGTTYNSIFREPNAFLSLRSPAASVTSMSGVVLLMRSGGMQAWSDNELLFTLPGFDPGAFVNPTSATPGQWYRVEVVLRGTSLAARAYRKGTAPPPWTLAVITNAYPVEGVVAWCLGQETASDQAVHIDNVHIEALTAGLNVTPDGTVTVRDPQADDEAANLRTLIGPAWSTPTNFRSGVLDRPTNPIGYRYHNGYLELTGSVGTNNVATNATLTLFNIAPPGVEKVIGGVGGSGYRPGRIIIGADGVVQWHNGDVAVSTLVYFDGIRLAL